MVSYSYLNLIPFQAKEGEVKDLLLYLHVPFEAKEGEVNGHLLYLHVPFQVKEGEVNGQLLIFKPSNTVSGQGG